MWGGLSLSLFKLSLVILFLSNLNIFTPPQMSNRIFGVYLIFFALYIFIYYNQLGLPKGKKYLYLLEMITITSPIITRILSHFIIEHANVLYLLFTGFIICTSILMYVEIKKTKVVKMQEKVTNKLDLVESRESLTPMAKLLLSSTVSLIVGILIIGMVLRDIPFLLVWNTDVLIYGLIGGFAPALYIYSLIQLKMFHIPENQYTKELHEIVSHPWGPVAIALCASLSEELLFRVAILGMLLKYMDPLYGVLAVSIIFMLAHYPQYKSSLSLNIGMFLASLIFSIVLIVTKSIWTPIIAHALYNYIVSFWYRRHFHIPLRGVDS